MKKLFWVLFLFSISLAKRPFPNTRDGIYVFNDQLAGWMSEEQFGFAATHYVGTQKMLRLDADKLRSYNPDFLILHYRLGLGLGYREVIDGEPKGDYLRIIEGDEWLVEWPGDESVEEEWFFHWDGQRVLNLDWGWYVMKLDNLSWRGYWMGEIKRQLTVNDNDGLFADSYSIPNYLGWDHYSPTLPQVDSDFEQKWADRIHNFADFVRGEFGDDYWFIPNIGTWVTSRNPTDYSNVDGVMIEGFSEWGPQSPFDLADWQLQMNRILNLVRQDKIILCQSYIYEPSDIQTRLFYLTNYLLIKGNYTYINMDYGEDPEYFPEYGLNLGSPTNPLPSSIDGFYNSGWGVYLRNYKKGMVMVNPDADSKNIDLGQTFYLTVPRGGGIVPEDGDISSWGIDYQPVDQLTLPPYSGAVLLGSVGIEEKLKGRSQSAKVEDFPTIISSNLLECLNTCVPGRYIKIYDIKGRLISSHDLDRKLKSGIYFIESRWGTRPIIKKVVFLR